MVQDPIGPDDQEASEPEESLKFEALINRFKAKMDTIRPEYHVVLGWLYTYRHIQGMRTRLANKARQLQGDGKRVFWAYVLSADMRLPMSATITGAILEAERAEEQAGKELGKSLRKLPWYTEVAVPAARGIGMSDRAGMLSAAKILDAYIAMSRFGTIGQLMRYSRLAPENGKAPKRTAGARIKYNPKAFQALFDLSEAWIKLPECHWRQRWDYWKTYYRERYPDLKTHPPMRIHQMGRRKVMREFLHELWELWRDWEARQQ